MITSASLHASAVVSTRRPGLFGLGPRRRALAQPDADVDARLLHVQRVGVALGAVPEHRDLAALEQREVGVVVVVDGRGHGSLLVVACSGEQFVRRRGSSPHAAWPDGGPAWAGRCGPVRWSSMIPNGCSRSVMASSFSGAPATWMVRASWPTSSMRAWKIEASSVICERSSARGLHRDEHELALDRLVGVQLGDLDHRDQLVELLGDLLERRRLGVDHDRHPAEPLVLGRADRERHDVEPAPREQAGDAREHAELVLHQHAEDVVLAARLARCHQSRPPVTVVRGVEDHVVVRSCRPRPSGTPSPGSRCGSRSPPDGRRSRSPSRSWARRPRACRRGTPTQPIASAHFT